MRWVRRSLARVLLASAKAGLGHNHFLEPFVRPVRDVFHLVLSMPTRTDPLSVQRAARDFAQREFSGFQYAMVLHTFETDPDPHPSAHLHVHLTVKAAGLDGVRFNPRKADLQRWREGFAEALREHGIEATTTSRIHRMTQERWTVRHLHEPSRKGGDAGAVKPHHAPTWTSPGSHAEL